MTDLLYDSARAAALGACAVMDTPREPMFDNIVFTLAQVARVPTAALVLVQGDRIWAKAVVGARIPDWTRVAAFCHSVIEAGELLAIEDATADRRLGPPTEPDAPGTIGFAAGAPVLGPEGYRIGCLCVLDRRRRSLSPRQAVSLQLLTEQAGEMLQFRVRTPRKSA